MWRGALECAIVTQDVFLILLLLSLGGKRCRLGEEEGGEGPVFLSTCLKQWLRQCRAPFS